MGPDWTRAGNVRMRKRSTSARNIPISLACALARSTNFRRVIMSCILFEAPASVRWSAKMELYNIICYIILIDISEAFTQRQHSVPSFWGRQIGNSLITGIKLWKHRGKEWRSADWLDWFTTTIYQMNMTCKHICWHRLQIRHQSRC